MEWSPSLRPAKELDRYDLPIHCWNNAHLYFSPSRHPGSTLGVRPYNSLIHYGLSTKPYRFFAWIPFSFKDQVLEREGIGKAHSWMWGINGLSSVVGSAATIVVAISLGFAEALLISAACYFIVFLIFRKP
jgi:hypothetical protein